MVKVWRKEQKLILLYKKWVKRKVYYSPQNVDPPQEDTYSFKCYLLSTKQPQKFEVNFL